MVQQMVRLGFDLPLRPRTTSGRVFPIKDCSRIRTSMSSIGPAPLSSWPRGIDERAAFAEANETKGFMVTAAVRRRTTGVAVRLRHGRCVPGLIGQQTGLVERGPHQ